MKISMIMKQFLTISLAALFILSLFGIAALGVQAEDNNGNYPPIIEKLAERFSLNIDELKEFFDEFQEERHQEMKAHFEEKFGEETPPGFNQLTDEQKEALAAKREELKAEFEAIKNLSFEERQAKMEELRAEMKAWAEENGIEGFIGLGFGHGFRGGPKWGFGPCPELTDDSIQE
jgi:hypothetical protein